MSSSDEPELEYDYIIAGGGTAGCVLASRLSELENVTVLLLEAGVNQNDDSRVKIPALVVQAVGDPSLDWNYHSIPQEMLNGKKVLQARGKGLGGSSLINLLGLVYPSEAGLNTWAEMGNPGWDWCSMLPYLRKFHTFHTPDANVRKQLHLEYINQDAHGKDGPIHASYPHDATQLDQAWIQTFKNLGIEMKEDTLSGRSIGGYQIVSSVAPSLRERSHAGNAYLDPAKHRSNLDIMTNTMVEKIVFRQSDVPQAYKVIFEVDGQVRQARARREIISCCGTFGSPALLERSGIGQSELLKRLDIPVMVANDGVGENLQDHIMVGVSFELNDGIDSNDNFRDPEYIQSAMAQYQGSRTGPMAGACISFAYMPLLGKSKSDHDQLEKLVTHHFKQAVSVKTTSSQQTSRQFVRQILLDPSEAAANMCMLINQVHLEKNTMVDMCSLTEEGSFISLFTALSHPLSRGNVHINSESAISPPVIDPKYYSDPLDLEIMTQHVHDVFPQVIATAPLANLLKKDGKRIPEFATFLRLEDTEKVVRESCMSNYHVCGTCAMLPESQGGVVDSELKVYGVRGLRIVDASIMPIVPRGNIMSCVYALAEKAADMIKNDLNRSQC